MKYPINLDKVSQSARPVYNLVNNFQAENRKISERDRSDFADGMAAVNYGVKKGDGPAAEKGEIRMNSF
jgi:hypothetical protein